MAPVYSCALLSGAAEAAPRSPDVAERPVDLALAPAHGPRPELLPQLIIAAISNFYLSRRSQGITLIALCAFIRLLT